MALGTFVTATDSTPAMIYDSDLGKTQEDAAETICAGQRSLGRDPRFLPSKPVLQAPPDPRNGPIPAFQQRFASRPSQRPGWQSHGC